LFPLVFIKRTGNAVILLPVEHSWQSWVDSLDGFSDDFMAERDQPQAQPRESLSQ
jgi:antitoxin VapB